MKKGFKYFDVLQRSREEFLLFIPRNNDVQRSTSSLLPPNVAAAHSASPPAAATATATATETKDESSIEAQQHRPPAINPRDEVLKEMNDRYTVILFTGYLRYMCPYIYVRNRNGGCGGGRERWMGSLQQRRFGILTIDGQQFRSYHEEGTNFDAPFELQTTLDWRRKDVELWEMVIEVLSVILKPCPPNPFQVDLAFIDKLPLEEGLLLTGALLNFLQTVWAHATPSKASLLDAVYEDIKALQTRHLSHMYQYSIESQPLQ
ncbi:hypothetical protein BX666DRAFT_1376322 [Dichotomocladium elegans]|nr:hypothetical protein BX666DRAFT_1376322 [Dichotomocladium elegans]